MADSSQPFTERDQPDGQRKETERETERDDVHSHHDARLLEERTRVVGSAALRTLSSV